MGVPCSRPPSDEVVAAFWQPRGRRQQLCLRKDRGAASWAGPGAELDVRELSVGNNDVSRQWVRPGLGPVTEGAK